MALLKFGKSKKPEQQAGKFIVIDGSDGSGKATQMQLLIEEMQTAGYQVETADFPQYGQKSAVFVEEYLKGNYGQVNPQAASIFYAVDRFQASFQMKDWLAQEK